MPDFHQYIRYVFGCVYVRFELVALPLDDVEGKNKRKE